MKDVEIITNFYGRTVAKISKERSGRYRIDDFYGRTLGYYEPKDFNGEGATYDFYGRMIARGNVLTSLIEKWD